MRDELEGYCIPLRTSLTRPLLLGGVPRTFAILNATVAAAIAFGLQQPLIGLPLWLVIQSAGAYASARDAWFLETWPRAMAKPAFFNV
ncbi:MAG: VirB3 family type IV secretion system protein [Hyphomonadaceae bacterium]|nr:VirB3 family type IV secretion system protein [Hyphomonadaceae bacterium]